MCKSTPARSDNMLQPSQTVEFKCPECPETFRVISLLRRHATRAHDNVKVYSCFRCVQLFPSEAALSEHSKTHYTEKPLSCRHCSAKFPTNKALRLHFDTNHASAGEFGCDQCDKKFFQKDLLERHLNTHARRRYKCQHCNKMFSDTSKFERHLRMHTGEGPALLSREPAEVKPDKSSLIQPQRTEQVKPDKSSLIQPQRTEQVKPDKSSLIQPQRTEQVKPDKSSLIQPQRTEQVVPTVLACGLCPERFHDVPTLRKHRLGHAMSGNGNIKRKSYDSDNTVRQEPKRMHTDYMGRAEYRDENDDFEEKYFECVECVLKFSCLDKWSSHAAMHSAAKARAERAERTLDVSAVLGDENLPPVFVNTPPRDLVAAARLSPHLECSDCGARLTSRAAWLRHCLAHRSEPSPCWRCGEYFDGTPSLQLHNCSIETGAARAASDAWSPLQQLLYPYGALPAALPALPAQGPQGPQGSLTLVRSGAGAWMVGVKETRPADSAPCDQQTPTKAFPCSLCSMSYSMPSALKKHMLAHTETSRIHKCQRCPLRFSSAAALGRHFRTHVGRERPYDCDLCGTSYRFPTQLARHQLTHSKADSHYACSHCEETFKNRNEYQKHLRVHSTTWPFKCNLCGMHYQQRYFLDRHLARDHSGESLPSSADKEKSSCKDGILPKEELSCEEECLPEEESISDPINYLEASRPKYAKPYTCTLCATVFKKRKVLLRHLKGHLHQERPGADPQGVSSPA